jgi:hypothetical protein
MTAALETAPFPTDSTAKKPAPYGAQRAYVKAAMRLIAGLLEAASEADPVVAKEVAGLPDGLVVGMSVFGMPDVGLRVVVRGSRLRVTDRSLPIPPEAQRLEIVYKHVTHAFLVFAFEEGTALAFANGRMSVEGELGYAMRLVRCLDRCETITLPHAVAVRAVKTVRDVETGERVKLAARTLAGLVAGLVKGAER